MEEIKQLVLTADETAKYEAFAAKMQQAIDEAKANNDDNALWHARRTLGLGGSEMGCVMGVNEYQTPFQFWEIKTGRKPSFSGNNATHWGTILEQVVADEYCRITGNKVRKESKHYNASKFGAPFLVGNIDRLILANDKTGTTTKILECKTARDNAPDANGVKKWGVGNRYDSDGKIIQIDDVIPDSYYIQVQHYMLLLDKQEADLAVFFLSTRTFAIYTIKRDAEICNALLQFGKDFMFNNIIDDESPEMTAQDYDNLGLAVSSEAVTASGTILDAVKNLKEVKQNIKDLEAEKEKLEELIKLFTADHTQLADVDGKLIATYKSIVRTSFDSKKFKEDYPEIYEKYSERKVCARSLLFKK